jgi:hypothetical protein
VDLRLYARVIWRFRLLVVTGLLLACGLAFLSFFNVSSAGVRYRQSEIYKSSTMVLLTQRGFPWGRTLTPDTVDASRFTALAPFYAQLANGDEVRALVRRSGPLNGIFTATPVLDETSTPRQGLPFISVDAFASTGPGAVRLSRRVTKAFQTFLGRNQRAARIPTNQRVVVQVVNQARKAKLVEGRKLTLPIVVFLTVMIATLGLAFLLENLRPRLRQLPAETSEEAASATRARQTVSA